jgi:hypothetical protein
MVSTLLLLAAQTRLKGKCNADCTATSEKVYILVLLITLSRSNSAITCTDSLQGDGSMANLRAPRQPRFQLKLD